MSSQAFTDDEFLLEDARLVRDLVRFSPTAFNHRRLAILLELYSTPAVDFSQLKHDTGLKDGILAVHMKKLVASRFVEAKKEGNSRNKTRYAITENGRHEFLELLSLIRNVNESISRRNLK